jgi:hypothetical protein
MSLSVLVPFRGDGYWRDQAWDYCLEQWLATGIDVAVGEHPGTGPFNIARAFNDAASQASGDHLFLIGADTIPDPARITEVDVLLETYPWVPGYSRTGVYGLDATEAIYAGADPDTQDFEHLYYVCTGILGVRAEAWAEIGGMDERFNGWGYEDNALRTMLTTLYGEPPSPDATARCLYHPPQGRAEVHANRMLYSRYEQAAHSIDAVLQVRFG